MLCLRKNCTTTAPMPPIATTRTMESPTRYPASVRQSASPAATVVLAVRLIGTLGSRASAISRSELSTTSRCPATPLSDRGVIPSGTLRTKDFPMKESMCG